MQWPRLSPASELRLKIDCCDRPSLLPNADSALVQCAWARSDLMTFEGANRLVPLKSRAGLGGGSCGDKRNPMKFALCVDCHRLAVSIVCTPSDL